MAPDGARGDRAAFTVRLPPLARASSSAQCAHLWPVPAQPVHCRCTSAPASRLPSCFCRPITSPNDDVPKCSGAVPRDVGVRARTACGGCAARVAAFGPVTGGSLHRAAQRDPLDEGIAEVKVDRTNSTAMMRERVADEPNDLHDRPNDVRAVFHAGVVRPEAKCHSLAATLLRLVELPGKISSHELRVGEFIRFRRALGRGWRQLTGGDLRDGCFDLRVRLPFWFRCRGSLERAWQLLTDVVQAENVHTVRANRAFPSAKVLRVLIELPLSLERFRRLVRRGLLHHVRDALALARTWPR